MSKEFKGEAFLKTLLKIDGEISEMEDEMRYWQRALAKNHSASIAKEVEKRREKLETIVSANTNKKLIAAKMIDEIEDPIGRAILRRRYIMCDRWPVIADACGGMSERNAHYIHDNALKTFEEIYKRYAS